MADFRKWVLVFAVLAAIVVPASAQTAIVCTATSGTPTQVRQEGLAELLGDVVLTCTGDTPGPTNINVQIFTGAVNVTSRIVDTGSTTESLLLLGNNNANGGEPGSGNGTGFAANINTFQGKTSGANSLVWVNVPLTVTAASGTTRVIRITNVRGNASQATGTAGFPGIIQELISITGTQTVTLTNNLLTVAVVNQGLTSTAIRSASGGSNPGFSGLATCTGRNTKLAGGDLGQTPAIEGSLRYRENFATAFKPVGGGGAGMDQTVTNKVYPTESGLNVPTAAGLVGGTAVGQATQGTRLYATFNAVPAGVDIYVTTTSLSASDSNGSAPNLVGTLVTFDPTLPGTSTPPAAPTGLALSQISSSGTPCTSTAGAAAACTMYKVPIVNGTGSVVWEVTVPPTATSYATAAANAAGTTETLLFGFVLAYASNINIGTATVTPQTTVTMGYAPISTVATASSSAPVPRFVPGTSVNFFTLQLCVTNLLFPFVTNQGGFDTGMALVNTSLDTGTGLNTTAQHGTCTVYYFGNMASGGQLPSAQTTTDIAAGQMVAFTLQSGGVPGATASAAGFQGYIIVRCNFQFAHGFAFISAPVGSVSGVAQGYLALVIPALRDRVADPFTTAGSGSGEQLAQ